VLGAGRVLRPQDLGVMSSIGLDAARVVRRPRVRLVITGNELLPTGTRPHGFQITDANGPMLAALAERDGAVVDFPGLIRDDADTTSNDVIRGVLQSMALPDADAVLERATSNDTKERLRQRSDEAVARGIFGAPTFLIGDELYWGNDRLEDALAYCTGLRSS